MTVRSSHNHEDLTTLEFFGIDQQLLLSGAGPGGPSEMRDSLEKAALFSRVTGYQTLNLHEPCHWPKQNTFPGIQFLVLAALENGFDELILEFCIILSKKHLFLPANLLPVFMDRLIKFPDQFRYLLPVLGPRAVSVAKVVSEWAVYDPENWTKPFQFKSKNLKKLAFWGLCQTDYDKAIEILMEPTQKMQEEDRRYLAGALLDALKPEKWSLLKIFEHSKFQCLQEIWYKLALFHDPEYRRSCLRWEDRALNLDSNWKPRLYTLNGKELNWPIQSIVSTIPPSCIEDHLDLENYFTWIMEHGLEGPFLQSFHHVESAVIKIQYFNWLLNSDQLTESFPTGELTRGLDHVRFNDLCQTWLSSSKSNIDLEAFYQANVHHSHFWSEPLCKLILELRNEPEYQKHYDLTVFWQMLPCKINPNSDLANKIPEECKCYTNRTIHYDSILRFRKWMRGLAENIG